MINITRKFGVLNTKSSEKVKVFVASGTPKGALTTIGSNDINTSYIEAAGGVNIAPENISKKSSTSSNEGNSVDFEFLYKNQPDVIIVTSKSTYDYIMDTSSSNQWQSLTAVKNKKVYLNPKGVYL
ncbi:ABC transporter substrate-binding protein [Clostridium sp. WILCCON 0269]|uniref:ABC transporter substrate-binding protein n=1 Tax=Candidatus Clostridium eludens TaxID=3381663 RepID=A0ABW8SN55_9CLOT